MADTSTASWWRRQFSVKLPGWLNWLIALMLLLILLDEISYNIWKKRYPGARWSNVNPEDVRMIVGNGENLPEDKSRWQIFWETGSLS